jgi:diguanylate cyclase (GGDEF)-like protein
MTDLATLLEQRLASARTPQDQVDAMNDLAWELRNQQPDRALALSAQAYERATTGPFLEQPHSAGQAASLTTRAYLNRSQGKLDLALDQSFQALNLLEGQAPSRAAIDCRRIISWIYYFLGEHASALSYGLKALEISRALGLRVQEASVLDSLAMIHAASGDRDEAVRQHAEALTIAREAGDEVLESTVLNNSAIVLLERGEPARALQAGEQGLEIARRLGLYEQQVAVSDTLGQILRRLGEPARAEKVLGDALAMAASAGQELGAAYCHLSLGSTYLAQGDAPRAQANFRQSLEAATRMSARPLQMDCHARLAELAEQQEDWKQALAHQRAFHDLDRQIHGENVSKRMAILKVAHQVEAARRDAEIYHLRNEELTREIEQRKQVEAALHQLAVTDPLTGLYNRRHFFSLAQMLLEQAARYQHPLSALMLDIDHFKRVNDARGYVVGDEALRCLAANIKRSIRAVDVAARFGGDEFVILLPETDLAHATLVAERLRRSVAKSPVGAQLPDLTLSLSIGVASFSAGQSVDALLEQADHALSAAKQAGWNQVQAFKP